MREKNRKLEDIAKRSNIWFTFKGKPNLDKWLGKWSQDGAYNWSLQSEGKNNGIVGGTCKP